MEEQHRLSLQDSLVDVIMRVLVKHPELYYYQVSVSISFIFVCVCVWGIYIYTHEYLCKELLLKYKVLLDTLHVISCYPRVFMTFVWLSCWSWMKIWHLLWWRNCHLVIWGKLSFSFERKGDLLICRSAHTHICLHTHIHTRLLVNNVVGCRASCGVRKGSWRMTV